ncbi:FmdB family zinc ribbon protein [Oceanidesulfovibrio marinus]|uniref:Zinc ribbon domain-containing protein n=1 Tax=Oceanidesulfovibrio marinus TaxID=370038 RepID=A0A6P1ZBV8_9BACT|nr:FmdB family zinc ribbon protein [Oceanidesulfovibrio marinus]TVM31168.1 zinc ribbon domain-containing protein [Oceanidesulfovibrio marinus]
MPLYDYECDGCGAMMELFYKIEIAPQEFECQCGGTFRKVILLGHGGIKREEAPWIPDVCEVVDRDGGEHCQRFLQEPNRANYHRWMEKEGVRPLEPGEPLRPPKKKPTVEEMTDATLKQMQKDRATTL